MQILTLIYSNTLRKLQNQLQRNIPKTNIKAMQCAFRITKSYHAKLKHSKPSTLKRSNLIRSETLRKFPNQSSVNIIKTHIKSTTCFVVTPPAHRNHETPTVTLITQRFFSKGPSLMETRKAGCHIENARSRLLTFNSQFLLVFATLSRTALSRAVASFMSDESAWAHAVLAFEASRLSKHCSQCWVCGNHILHRMGMHWACLKRFARRIYVPSCRRYL